MKDPIQSILHSIEVGRASFLVRLVPLAAVFLVICACYDMRVYRGLGDAQSMDNAQLARQISRGQGYTTKFIRPHALAQISNHVKNGNVFPPEQFPPGAPRTISDTYNAPGYPLILAIWFKLWHPNFAQTPKMIQEAQMYSGDVWIPELNQIFLFITAGLVFGLGRRLFDQKVAWMATVAFLATDLVWQFSLTALSTNLLMMVVTAGLFVTNEILLVSEQHFERRDRPFWPAWLWTLLLAGIMGLACLIRLDLLILLLPLGLFFYTLPRINLFLFPVLAVIVLGIVAPWFWYMYQVSGNPLGSNQASLLAGEGTYAGEQVYRQLSIPTYEKLFKDVSVKEYSGFLWHMEHGWQMLGVNPLVLFFAASILHLFRRRRAQAFRWLVIGMAIGMVLMDNLGDAKPETLGSANVLMILLPATIVIGGAFFFILLDRLNLELWLVANFIIGATLLLAATPLALAVSPYSYKYYNYPPYSPPLLNLVGQITRTDEWVATDLPWATAWYGDRASLWLPDTVADLLRLNDSVCPCGVVLMTPATLSKSATNLTTGEDSEWFFLATGIGVPERFPFKASTGAGKGGPEYRIWSDRPRWEESH